MKQVIAEILDEEKEARRRVEEAGEKARTIRLKAEEDAKRRSASIREKAQKEATETVTRAEAEAQKEREKAHAEASQKGKMVWKDKEKEIRGAVDKLFKIVLGIEGK